jgi:hypothetical protein
MLTTPTPPPLSISNSPLTLIHDPFTFTHRILTQIHQLPDINPTHRATPLHIIVLEFIVRVHRLVTDTPNQRPLLVPIPVQKRYKIFTFILILDKIGNLPFTKIKPPPYNKNYLLSFFLLTFNRSQLIIVTRTATAIYFII